GGVPGVRLDGTIARIRIPRAAADLDLSVVTVPGRHNLEHAATAAMLALHMGADPAKVQEALGSLRALAHRMEPVGTVDGRAWINDSKGTNVASTLVGLRGMDRPCVVLLGGEAKGPGFAELAPALAAHRAVITFGGSGTQIADELAAVGVRCHRVAWMRDAMELARTLAEAGDAVLLSPACASFDEFRNFEHRGDVFRAFVQEVGP
ncbi:MAG TPA: cyanophycin synthetase, partial [Myxococcota bacterium]|nr:cyanophycin synthetase [Myxococcota bacterium]